MQTSIESAVLPDANEVQRSSGQSSHRCAQSQLQQIARKEARKGTLRQRLQCKQCVFESRTSGNRARRKVVPCRMLSVHFANEMCAFARKAATDVSAAAKLRSFEEPIFDNRKFPDMENSMEMQCWRRLRACFFVCLFLP
jgi:hypothetical protein